MKSLIQIIDEALGYNKVHLEELESNAESSLSDWLWCCKTEEDFLSVILDIGEILGGASYGLKKYPDTKEEKDLGWYIEDIVNDDINKLIKSLNSYEKIYTNDFCPNKAHQISNHSNLNNYKRSVEVYVLNCKSKYTLNNALYKIFNDVSIAGKKLLKKGHPALNLLKSIVNKFKQ